MVASCHFRHDSSWRHIRRQGQVTKCGGSQPRLHVSSVFQAANRCSHSASALSASVNSSNVLSKFNFIDCNEKSNEAPGHSPALRLFLHARNYPLTKLVCDTSDIFISIQRPHKLDNKFLISSIVHYSVALICSGSACQQQLADK